MIETAISFWADIKRYEDMLEADPRSYCFAPLSELYRKLGLLDDAVSVAKRGCALHPDYAGGFLALASALADKGLKVEAREALERVVSISPDNLKAQRLLGQVYAEAGETALAQHALRRVLADDPNDAESALLLRTISGAPVPEGQEEVLEEVELVEELTEELPEEGSAETWDAADEISGAFLDGLSEGGAEFPEEGAEEPEPEPLTPSTVPAPGGKDPLTTATMAELYVSQGFPEKALRIYRALLEDEPANLSYSRRAKELAAAIAGAPAGAAPPTPGATAAPAGEERAAAAAVGAPGVEPAADSPKQQVEILEKWLENIQRRKRHAL